MSYNSVNILNCKQQHVTYVNYD